MDSTSFGAIGSVGGLQPLVVGFSLGRKEGQRAGSSAGGLGRSGMVQETSFQAADRARDSNGGSAGPAMADDGGTRRGGTHQGAPEHWGTSTRELRDKTTGRLTPSAGTSERRDIRAPGHQTPGHQTLGHQRAGASECRDIRRRDTRRWGISAGASESRDTRRRGIREPGRLTPEQSAGTSERRDRALVQTALCRLVMGLRPAAEDRVRGSELG